MPFYIFVQLKIISLHYNKIEVHICLLHYFPIFNPTVRRPKSSDGSAFFTQNPFHTKLSDVHQNAFWIVQKENGTLHVRVIRP